MKTTASAYVKEGRLCIVGLHSCELGPIPFAYSAGVAKEIPDGPVDLDNSDLDPNVLKIIDESKEPMLAIIEREKMRVGAEQLVERARAGDQNAMAMIGEVRQNAEKGIKKAKRAFAMLHDYIKSHPILEGSSDHHYRAPKVNKQIVRKLSDNIGEDAAISAWTPGIPDLYLAALVVASGPVLKPERVTNIGSHFGDDTPRFWFGFEKWNQPKTSKDSAVFTGQVVGLARTIQGVREGYLPVSRLCPMAGWELGE